MTNDLTPVEAIASLAVALEDQARRTADTTGAAYVNVSASWSRADGRLTTLSVSIGEDPGDEDDDE